MKKQIEGLEDLAQLEPTRPLFSVIISCYNSRKTIGALLESLCNQNLEYEDLEVIISDDCSTEPYDDIVQNYLNKLMIKEIKTEYNCCPSNTRETGAQAATGQWICFSDHDDIFIDESLGELKRRINEGLDEQYCIYTSFYELKPDYLTILKKVPASDSGGWTHGKFFNLDKLWKDYDIHYKKDLKSHEDIYLICYINVVLDKIHARGANALTTFDDLYTYGWVTNPDSLSHKKYEDNYNFLELHFPDYVEATGFCYLDGYYKNIIPYDRMKQYTMDSILLYYFYDESFYFENPNRPREENRKIITKFVKTVKKLLNIDNNAIWQFAANNHGFAYNRAWDKTNIGTGGIVQSHTLAEWLEIIDKDDSTIYQSPYYVLQK